MPVRRRSLAEYRKAAGYSQEALAEALRVETSTVGRWERGETRPQPWTRPKLARALGVSHEALAELLDDAAGLDTVGSVPESIAEEVAAPLRRDFLKHGVAAVACERTNGWRSVTLVDIEALNAMQHSLIALDAQHGGGAVLSMAMAYLRSEVTPLLQGRYPERVGRRLFAAAAGLTLTTGFIAYDAGQHGLARQHFVHALSLSRTADDPALSARVVTAMSHQALYLDDRDDALVFARLASSGATACVPVIQAICAATEARVSAVIGDKQGCFALMDKTEQAFSRVRAEETPAWSCFLDEAELAGKFGRCLRDLGLHADADQQLEMSLNLHKTSYPRSRAITQIIHATNHVRQGNLEHACQLGITAMPAVGRLRSQRVSEYLRDLRDHLAPYAHEPTVRAFSEQARAVLATREV